MNMRQLLVSTLGVSALLLTSGSLAQAPAAQAAQAAQNDVICHKWGSSNGNFFVHATDLGERNYRVTITDLTMAAYVDPDTDSYIPLPVELQYAMNQVQLNPTLGVSSIEISQRVIAEETTEFDQGLEITGYERLPSAPGESAEENSNGITWTQDIDGYRDADGVQSLPSDFPFFAAQLASAGVLEFTVTVPADLSGEVLLFDELQSSFLSSVLNTNTNEITAGPPITTTVPGCSVTLAEVVVPPEPKPEPKPQPEALANSGASIVPTVLFGAASAAMLAGGYLMLRRTRTRS